MNIDINALALKARQSLHEGNQIPFETLYNHPEIRYINRLLLQNYRPGYSVLNIADLQAIFDDTFLAIVMKYEEGKDFLPMLQREIYLSRIDLYRGENAEKRRTVHMAAELVVTEVGDFTDKPGAFQVAGPENVEFEAIFRILCEQLEPHEERLLRALVAHDIYRKSGAKQASLAQIAEECGFRNRQQAHRLITKLREIVA